MTSFRFFTFRPLLVVGISCMKTPGDRLLVGAGNYSEANGDTYSPAALSWPSGTSWEKAFTVAAKSGDKVTITGFAFGSEPHFLVSR